MKLSKGRQQVVYADTQARREEDKSSWRGQIETVLRQADGFIDPLREKRWADSGDMDPPPRPPPPFLYQVETIIAKCRACALKERLHTEFCSLLKGPVNKIRVGLLPEIDFSFYKSHNVSTGSLAAFTGTLDHDKWEMLIRKFLSLFFLSMQVFISF